MANILPDNEVIEFEDRTYTNPQVSLDEGLAFIDNLRNIQNQNNAEINAQTTNLGAYPATQSNLGGLGGGESYFTSRYQVPQGVALANNLRATAQAQALSDVLQNEMSMMKQRYTNAQRAARQRAAARANYGGGGGDPTQDPVTGGSEENDTSKTINSAEWAKSPAASGTFDYTPNSLPNWGVIKPSGKLPGGSNTVLPAGNVTVNRNSAGKITSLTYNGKTWTGDAAAGKYWQLGGTGSLTNFRR